MLNELQAENNEKGHPFKGTVKMGKGVKPDTLTAGKPVFDPCEGQIGTLLIKKWFSLPNILCTSVGFSNMASILIFYNQKKDPQDIVVHSMGLLRQDR